MTAADSTIETGHRFSIKAWRTEILFAVPIVALVITLYYTWFAVRDRYQIFLYFHNMGAGFDTSPFGRVTASRYWMTGLVASGAVMIPYLLVNFLLGRFVKSYRPPVWWRVWILCAVPLTIAVPLIVMTVNEPVLPLVNAIQVIAALLAALAVAVSLGETAAGKVIDTLLLVVDGGGLACLLMALRAVESYQRWAEPGGRGSYYLFAFAVTLILGLGVLIVMTGVYAFWRKPKIPGWLTWLAAGAAIHYLFLPLYHYLCWCKDDGSWLDPDYFSYITDSDNYFTRSVLIQIGVWVVIIGVAFGLTRLRGWIRERRG
ncbi:MAG: hypothetical protein JXJ17_00425 [Anaerolineae bacterium]|nr:hypothetical protein [Anaerolineae bacterium]